VQIPSPNLSKKMIVVSATKIEHSGQKMFTGSNGIKYMTNPYLSSPTSLKDCFETKKGGDKLRSRYGLDKVTQLVLVYTQVAIVNRPG